MKPLIDKFVFCGFVTCWRFAGAPTSRWPSFVNATTDGVVRPPSAFGMTAGSPPSITATQELVVPRSIPIVFAMLESPSVERTPGPSPCVLLNGIASDASVRKSQSDSSRLTSRLAHSARASKRRRRPCEAPSRNHSGGYIPSPDSSAPSEPPPFWPSWPSCSHSDMRFPPWGWFAGTAFPPGSRRQTLVTLSCDGAAHRRLGPGNPQRAGFRHRQVQLPLPLLHAGGGSRVARARRAADLRGDRPSHPGPRVDGRRRGAADGRRAAGAAGPACA